MHRLERGLQGTPLASSWRALEQEAWRAKFSPYFIVGASGTESSFGEAACSGNWYNIWGLGACDRAWLVPNFPTRRAAYRYYVGFIRSTWPSARTAYELYGYCVPASYCGASIWGDSTYGHMRALFGEVSSSLAYPN